MIRFAQTEQRKSPIASSRFPTFALLAGTLLATFWAAGPAAAQTAPVPTTREEIQRERLEDRLQTQGEAVAVEEGAVERAPCPLADPQFADIRFTVFAAHVPPPTARSSPDNRASPVRASRARLADWPSGSEPVGSRPAGYVSSRKWAATKTS